MKSRTKIKYQKNFTSYSILKISSDFLLFQFKFLLNKKKIQIVILSETSTQIECNQSRSFQETPVTTLSGKKRKQYVKKSIVHRHTTKLGEGETAIHNCNYCPTTFSGKSTTNMKSHLINAHNISEIGTNSSDDQTDQFLIQFIISASKSLNASFLLPTRYNLSNTILNEQYQYMVRLIREELLVVQAVAITLDCWTSIQKYPYLGVTCHFFNRSLELCNRTLTICHLLGNHTCENISSVLYNILDEWNILGKIMDLCPTPL
ncbi:zinc finger BED domain-containing 1-like [Brachionus plicatilis]|uniref:Zinc finger BED domain-containing 1-like n=1 Tax=Brachionus plicatilis TaxID=10195 RepID=A0A3M7QMK5_BRAPC|nr:zinc finger BED domain-containing 1-like [Brachionus plicatilis]